MTVEIEIETVMQSYVVVSGLLEQREFEKEHNVESAVEAIDAVLAQFEGTTSDVLLERHDDYEFQEEA